MQQLAEMDMIDAMTELNVALVELPEKPSRDQLRDIEHASRRGFAYYIGAFRTVGDPNAQELGERLKLMLNMAKGTLEKNVKHESPLLESISANVSRRLTAIELFLDGKVAEMRALLRNAAKQATETGV